MLLPTMSALLRISVRKMPEEDVVTSFDWNQVSPATLVPPSLVRSPFVVRGILRLGAKQPSPRSTTSAKCCIAAPSPRPGAHKFLTILSFSSPDQRRRRPISTTSRRPHLGPALITVHKDSSQRRASRVGRVQTPERSISSSEEKSCQRSH